MRTDSGRHRQRKGEAGATVVEFAVIVALLFAIVVGIIEYSFIFLQGHLVANAAREGVRIGVRANNYNSATIPWVATEGLGEAACAGTTDRAEKVDCEVRRYLESTLYPSPTLARPTTVTVNRDAGGTVLQVRVDVFNFFPKILSAWVSALPGAGGLAAPDRIVYTATGEYEDPDEANSGN